MLERELDLISLEAEEVAARSGSGLESRFQGGRGGATNVNNGMSANDLESNSLASGATGSMSANSLIAVRQNSQHRKDPKKANSTSLALANNVPRQQQQGQITSASEHQAKQNSRTTGSSMDGSRRFNKKLSYSTVEEVFNRKIILEKERDKLKKEVEAVIIECDKLQQRYKKRDDILDKLFDGRAGNGLENHLEQQLNWLLEQKHYVDQVFYAWKRAETLTSRTCEQLASAIELLKKLPDIEDEEQRIELTKSICDLLKASRQDMEQAQKYNPNVDAPFLTEAETKRFDKIINTISSCSVKSSEYGQISTVIQFAYKRAASIKLWLEQILQITIARDSFELAEEYKWIAIQLRKERITLIKTKLQESPYRSIVRSVHEQMASAANQQQQQQQLMTDSKRTNEINRDSGVESDDIDIEEEIYRLLELNRERLEGAANRQYQQQQQQQQTANGGVGIGSGAGTTTPSRTGVVAGAQSNGLDGSGSGSTSRLRLTDQNGRRMQLAVGQSRSSQQQQQSLGLTSGGVAGAGNSWTPNREQAISERIERRMRGEKGLETNDALHPSSLRTDPSPALLGNGVGGGGGDGGGNKANSTNRSMTTTTTTNQETGSASQLSSATLSQLPSKLKVELDEAARQDLLSKLLSFLTIQSGADALRFNRTKLLCLFSFELYLMLADRFVV